MLLWATTIHASAGSAEEPTREQLGCALCALGKPAEQAWPGLSCLGMLPENEPRTKLDIGRGEAWEELTTAVALHSSYRQTLKSHPDAARSKAPGWKILKYRHEPWDVRVAYGPDETRATVELVGEPPTECPTTCEPCVDRVVKRTAWKIQEVDVADPIEVFTHLARWRWEADERLLAPAAGVAVLPSGELGSTAQGWRLVPPTPDAPHGTMVIEPVEDRGGWRTFLRAEPTLTREELVDHYAATSTDDSDRFELFSGGPGDVVLTWFFEAGVFSRLEIRPTAHPTKRVDLVRTSLGCAVTTDCENGPGTYYFADGLAFDGKFLDGRPIEGRWSHAYDRPAFLGGPSDGTTIQATPVELARYEEIRSELAAARAEREKQRREAVQRELAELGRLVEAEERKRRAAEAAEAAEPERVVLHTFGRYQIAATPVNGWKCREDLEICTRKGDRMGISSLPYRPMTTADIESFARDIVARGRASRCEVKPLGTSGEQWSILCQTWDAASLLEERDPMFVKYFALKKELGRVLITTYHFQDVDSDGPDAANALQETVIGLKRL